MRLRPAFFLSAVAAAAAAVPAAVRAQGLAGVPYGTYAGEGCGSGPLSVDPVTGMVVRGSVVCVVGSFAFTYLPSTLPGIPGQLQLVGTTVQTVSPAFAGTSVNSNGGQVFGQYRSAACPGGLCTGILAFISPFAALQPGANDRRITGFGLPLDPTTDLSSATIDSVRIVYDYAVPGLGPGAITTVAIAFSAVPEPSTFALGAVGGVALAATAVGRRRRRPAAVAPASV